jgi:DNA-binding transcriptional LysR family regulator
MGGLERVLLFNDPMHVAPPASHSLCSESETAPGTAGGRGVDRRNPQLFDASLYAPCLSARRLRPRIAFGSGDYDVVQALTALGVGVALIPELALESLRPGVEAPPVAGIDPSRRVFAA